MSPQDPWSEPADAGRGTAGGDALDAAVRGDTERRRARPARGTARGVRAGSRPGRRRPDRTVPRGADRPAAAHAHGRRLGRCRRDRRRGRCADPRPAAGRRHGAPRRGARRRPGPGRRRADRPVVVVAVGRRRRRRRRTTDAEVGPATGRPAPPALAGYSAYGDLSVLGTHEPDGSMPRSVALSGDGAVLAASGDDGVVRLFRVDATGPGGGDRPGRAARRPAPAGGPGRPAAGWAPAVSPRPCRHAARGVLERRCGHALGRRRPGTAPAAPDDRPADAVRPRRPLQPGRPVDRDGRVRQPGPALGGRRTPPRRRAGAHHPQRRDGARLEPGRPTGWPVPRTTRPPSGTPPTRRRREALSTVPTRTAGQIDLAFSPDGRTLYAIGESPGGYDVSGAAGPPDV